MNKLTIWLRQILPVILIIILTIPASLQMYAQQIKSLSIEEVYQMARKNYPLVKQRDLITKTKDYSVSNAAKGYLPVFSVNGQATYQSAVTNFPFHVPGITIPQFSKDQYKFYAEGDQVIYDGGVIKNQKQTSEANEVIQQQNLEVELYALYDRVNQLYFGALLEDEELKQNDLLQQDLQNGIDKANALVANGVAYRSSVDELSAQLLQSQQSRVELTATKKAYIDMLGLFIDAKLDDNTILEKPAAPALSDNINRPELLAFDYQKKIYDLQDKLLHDQLKPRVSFFAQGGYGRPGLNFLSNDFSWYYLGGLRLSWNFGSLYTLKNQQHLLDINKNSQDIQKETFLFNTKLSQVQQNENVQKYDSLIEKDDAIIKLRASVKKAAYAQLENGVLSAHDYINQVNAEDQARQSKILHEMQLLQAQYSYQNIVGNVNNKD
jgi:outer membrane protein TolC